MIADSVSMKEDLAEVVPACQPQLPSTLTYHDPLVLGHLRYRPVCQFGIPSSPPFHTFSRQKKISKMSGTSAKPYSLWVNGEEIAGNAEQSVSWSYAFDTLYLLMKMKTCH